MRRVATRRYVFAHREASRFHRISKTHSANEQRKTLTANSQHATPAARSFHAYYDQRCSEAESPLVRMNRSVQFTVRRRCSRSVRHARPLMSEAVTATCQYERIPV